MFINCFAQYLFMTRQLEHSKESGKDANSEAKRPGAFSRACSTLREGLRSPSVTVPLIVAGALVATLSLKTCNSRSMENADLSDRMAESQRNNKEPPREAAAAPEPAIAVCGDTSSFSDDGSAYHPDTLQAALVTDQTVSVGGFSFTYPEADEHYPVITIENQAGAKMNCSIPEGIRTLPIKINDWEITITNLQSNANILVARIVVN